MSPTACWNGVSGESKGSRLYDKENLLWQFTVAIRSDPVGSVGSNSHMGSFRQDWREIYLAQRRRGAEEFLDRIDRIKKGAEA